MKVIVDANVAIAAIASRGLCEAVLELCLEQHHLVLCEGILDEVERKLKQKLKVPAPVVKEVIRLLRANADILDPDKVEKSICRDPGDLMVLGLVAPAKADVIITGDKDLLVLKKFGIARILSPRAFWDTVQKGK